MDEVLFGLKTNIYTLSITNRHIDNTIHRISLVSLHSSYRTSIDDGEGLIRISQMGLAHDTADSWQVTRSIHTTCSHLR